MELKSSGSTGGFVTNTAPRTTRTLNSEIPKFLRRFLCAEQSSAEPRKPMKN